MSIPHSEFHTPHSSNSRAWDALARGNDGLAQPARDEDFADPLRLVDPLCWLGADIRGKRLLCLAAGGGRHSALYAAAGAEVTVLDISPEMLARDRAVAAERRLNVRIVQGSMDDLSMFAAAEIARSPASPAAAASTSASTSRP
jgi:SAM-dependent methyltransferase